MDDQLVESIAEFLNAIEKNKDAPLGYKAGPGITTSAAGVTLALHRSPRFQHLDSGVSGPSDALFSNIVAERWELSIRPLEPRADLDSRPKGPDPNFGIRTAELGLVAIDAVRLWESRTGQHNRLAFVCISGCELLKKSEFALELTHNHVEAIWLGIDLDLEGPPTKERTERWLNDLKPFFGFCMKVEQRVREAGIVCATVVRYLLKVPGIGVMQANPKR